MGHGRLLVVVLVMLRRGRQSAGYLIGVSIHCREPWRCTILPNGGGRRTCGAGI